MICSRGCEVKEPQSRKLNLEVLTTKEALKRGLNPISEPVTVYLSHARTAEGAAIVNQPEKYDPNRSYVPQGAKAYVTSKPSSAGNGWMVAVQFYK